MDATGRANLEFLLGLSAQLSGKPKMLHGALREALQGAPTGVRIRRQSWQAFVHVVVRRGTVIEITSETGREWTPSVEDILARDWLVLGAADEARKCAPERMFDGRPPWGLRDRQA